MPNKINKHYENLAKLYLRLKGYLVSNLIIHSSENGMEKSELDIIAVKMPHHMQEYRWVNVEDYLEGSKSSVEILIGDVKNCLKLDAVQYNKGIRRDNESIKQLINWLGVFDNVNEELIEKFCFFLNLHTLNELKGFASFDEELTLGRFTFKFTFFCPSLSKWDGKGFKYIHGEEMIDFIWECLHIKQLDTCSRTYSYHHWNEFEIYVRFFKDAKEKVTKENFEQHFKKI